jgi:hypothetical protein
VILKALDAQLAIQLATSFHALLARTRMQVATTMCWLLRMCVLNATSAAWTVMLTRLAIHARMGTSLRAQNATNVIPWTVNLALPIWTYNTIILLLDMLDLLIWIIPIHRHWQIDIMLLLPFRMLTMWPCWIEVHSLHSRVLLEGSKNMTRMCRETDATKEPNSARCSTTMELANNVNMPSDSPTMDCVVLASTSKEE